LKILLSPIVMFADWGVASKQKVHWREVGTL
jgi:hypothetical protein